MNHAATRLLAVILTVFLFDFLFWEEKMGLNCLIFTFAWLSALLWSFPESRGSRRFLVTAAGMLLAAGMITWHNSAASKLAWMVSAMCAAGFAQERHLRFLLFALMQYLRSMVFAFGALNKSIFGGDHLLQKHGRSVRRVLGLTWLPLLVVVVFYGFYTVANPKFAGLSGQFWARLGRLLSFDISLTHLFFVVFALFVCGGAIWHKMTQWDEPASDFLQRVRQKFNKRYSSGFALSGLRSEHQQSLILLGMLNTLLFLVNLTDIRFVWFGFDEEVQQDLKSYVHVGTYALIASILVAMGVLFFVFRKNLNFYPENRRLKQLAAIWLIQNGILAASVAVRNWRYIDFHGLAYKRIGVFLFLLLVFVGLVTLWMRIRDHRNNFWLWCWNSWALYILLLLNACIGWDVLITRYNLSGRPRSTVDVQHMIREMSYKNLYLLEENIGQLEQIKTYPDISGEQIKKEVTWKRERFEQECRDLGWKSWNGADARNGMPSQ